MKMEHSGRIIISPGGIYGFSQQCFQLSRESRALVEERTVFTLLTAKSAEHMS